MYNYRSYHDLSLAVWRAIPSLADDVDLIVGVPRSGMIPALMLALYLNKRATSLDMLLLGRVYSSGLYRMEGYATEDLAQYRHILILDDTYCSGRAMARARKQVCESEVLKGYRGRISYAAVYVTPGNEDKLDYAFEILALPRMFQWNIFNHTVNSQACFDIDGVVCRDPSDEENDDGERYVRFMASVRPRMHTIHKISRFVSSRLERFRSNTEDWLRHAGFDFGRVELLNVASKEERQRQGCHAAFKAQVYAAGPETLFYESELRQAQEIACRTGKDVFCTENMRLLTAADVPSRPASNPPAPAVARPHGLGKAMFLRVGMGWLRRFFAGYGNG